MTQATHQRRIAHRLQGTHEGLKATGKRGAGAGAGANPGRVPMAPGAIPGACSLSVLNWACCSHPAAQTRLLLTGAW